MAYLGEIRMFGGTFAPQRWAICSGQTLPISEHESLFNLIGITYGGDGQETFKLPDLQGRVPVHRGRSPGVEQNYVIGEKAGVETVVLNTRQLPEHTHQLQASQGAGTSPNPERNVIGSAPAVTVFKREKPDRNLPTETLAAVGGGQPHPNRMPFVTLTYIICLDGMVPPR